MRQGKNSKGCPSGPWPQAASSLFSPIQEEELGLLWGNYTHYLLPRLSHSLPSSSHRQPVFENLALTRGRFLLSNVGIRTGSGEHVWPHGPLLASLSLTLLFHAKEDVARFAYEGHSSSPP